VVPLLFFGPTLMVPFVPTDEPPTTKKLWLDPKFLLINLISLIGMTSMFAYVPYLQPWFADSFGISKTAYGFITMFLVIAGFIAGSAIAPMLESATDSFTALIVGFALFGAGYLLLGPTPLFAAEGAGGLFFAIFAWWLLLVGNAFPVVLAPPMSIKYANEYGLNEDEAASQSATFNIAAMALSMMIGPVFGGVGADTIGVPWTNTAFGFNVIWMSVLGVFVLKKLDTKGGKSNELV